MFSQGAHVRHRITDKLYKIDELDREAKEYVLVELNEVMSQDEFIPETIHVPVFGFDDVYVLDRKD